MDHQCYHVSLWLLLGQDSEAYLTLVMATRRTSKQSKSWQYSPL
jgi:hypothetical protein